MCTLPEFYDVGAQWGLLNVRPEFSRRDNAGSRALQLSPFNGDKQLRSGADRYHLLPATLGRLWQELGETEKAAAYLKKALTCECSAPERRFLERQLTGPSATSVR